MIGVMPTPALTPVSIEGWLVLKPVLLAASAVVAVPVKAIAAASGSPVLLAQS
jgi:hypothetical protein